MKRHVVCAPSAELRLREAEAWLDAQAVGREVLVVGATHESVSEVIRAVAVRRGTGFGWHRLTLGRLAAELAKQRMADARLAPVGTLVVEALCARVIHRLRGAGQLTRLAAVANQPGLPRALARTLHEVRMAGASSLPAAHDHVAAHAELDALLRGLLEELAARGLADRARVFELATEVVRDRATSHPLCALPMLLVDVPVRTVVEHRLLEALVAGSPDVLATVPAGDDASRARLSAIVADVEVLHDSLPERDSLRRVQSHLFAQEVPPPAKLDDTVTIFSAPGESRECVEIARRIVGEAARGVPFDRIAVLLRSPEQYRIHLEEAFARAGIDAYFEQGTVKPDPSGRAFVALLACKADGLSARRFAEYLSLGEVPDASDDGAPPDALPSGDRWVPPDEELLPRALAAAGEDEEIDLHAIATSIAAPVSAGTLRAPWRWEQILVDASVIGGRERWERRLAGLEAKLRLEQEAEEHSDRTDRRARTLADLQHLRRFALPLLDELAALPASATWGDWLEQLGALATRALRRPDRVLQVLAKLAPTSEVGPVELAEIVLVLEPQLEELEVRPPSRRYGRVLVAPIEAARGMAFDAVFVPGLAERMFPQKIIEDPLLLDAMRASLPLELPVREDRLSDERLALRIAVGAARHKVILSYPRIDLQQGRPRVPSFYGLEVLEAAEGELPDFDELGRRADVTGAARIGWPAPAQRLDAIDEAEHDLALLGGLMSNVEAPVGATAYLADPKTNVHLARALRFRARRWTIKSWKPADGLVVESAPGTAALARHAPNARSFSPTALEQLAACPYRFALRALLRLEPREAPESIEQLGALERGSLIHEVQFELLSELRTAGALPVRAANLEGARDRLDGVLDRVAARFRDELCPAIDRVWDDGIAAIRADLREWLRRTSEDLDWIPERFELGFGPVKRGERDPASTDAEVQLDIGLSLRGSIDLVERASGPSGALGGTLRATDHKSGKASVPSGSIIANGASLQPVLYALVLEKLFPDAAVASGRLYYCTTRGNFSDVTVPLDDASRAAAKLLADTLAHHFEHRFFPAAPTEKACTYCDYRLVCGTQEVLRASKKQQDRLVQLGKLRGHK